MHKQRLYIDIIFLAIKFYFFLDILYYSIFIILVKTIFTSRKIQIRDVAQPGSAPRWG